MKRLLVLALALTVALLAALAWWHREPEHRPQLQTERAFPPPALQTGQAPAGSPPAWSSVAAQNGQDLKLEFERAMAQNSAVGWLVARDLGNECTAALDPMRRAQLDRELEALRADPASDPERSAKLALHAKRVHAIEELQHRCLGFRGNTMAWAFHLIRDTDARIRASDSELGRFWRINALAEQGKASDEEFFSALFPLLRSRDPVLAREGLAAARRYLYDFKLSDAQRDQVAEAWFALLMAWEAYSGQPVWGSELDALQLCIGLSACSETERSLVVACPPGTETQHCEALKVQYMDLKAQYLEVLKSGKLRGLADVKPKGWPG
jgi:hypothetical protein